MLTPIRLDTETRLGLMLASLAFFTALALAAFVFLHGCSTWQPVARETLKYHEAVALIATDAMRSACNAAIADCEAKHIPNPCPALEDCIYKIAAVNARLKNYVVAIKNAWDQLRDADVETWLKTTQTLTSEAGFFVGILGKFGVDFESQLKRLVP